MELVHRGITRLGIKRVFKLEKDLREGVPYDGPKISESFVKDGFSETMLSEALMPFVIIHYLGLLIAIVLIGHAS